MVTVRGVDDFFVDGDRLTPVTAAVDAAASDDAFDAATPETVGVTTTDDDVAGLSVSESAGSTVVGEDGSTDDIVVALTAAPLSPVSLAVTSSDLLEIVASPRQLTFTGADWNEAQVITLVGVDDLVADGPQVSTVTLSVVALFSDDAYDPVPDRVISVTTVDNDGADDDDNGDGD